MKIDWRLTPQQRAARAFRLAREIDRPLPRWSQPIPPWAPTLVTVHERKNKMTPLSKHFSLEELTASEIAVRKGLDNKPPPDVIENLKLLCVYLERVRDLLGVPMIVHSGYRSVKVNTAVGGSAWSAHTKGLACDFIAPEFGTPQEVAKMILESNIAFDQLIYEGANGGGWVHFSIGDNMRKQALTAHFGGGATTYTEGIA